MFTHPFLQDTLFALPDQQVSRLAPSPMALPTDAIILLDLNYTLVANSWLKRKEPGPYLWQIGRETYRRWLIDLISSHTVLLVTVRGQEFRQPTLSHLQDLTGWQPDAAYFNPTPAIFRGDIVKRAYLLEHILPHYGYPAQRPYFAIESNAPARRMYQTDFNIPACRAEDLQAAPLIRPS